ncbi:hypothetical protein CCR75_003505 [Bremia lactucae]|uniref:Uncharacterized protein n=1 Tax=Bremia lactucae TaxID=4779 RepID=A0A976IG52_BRELC|nr:hypothetical protein CCR75_003505 [Bremia lactucae]
MKIGASIFFSVFEQTLALLGWKFRGLELIVMKSLMLVEIKSTCKMTSTPRKRTRKWFLATTFLYKQVRTTGKSLGAFFKVATIRFFTSMNSVMHFHVGFAQKLFAAKFATKFLVAIVNVPVSF